MRAFNAFQLVAAFVAWPFLIVWLANAAAAWPFAGVAAVAAGVAYLVAFIFMIYAVYDAIGTD